MHCTTKVCTRCKKEKLLEEFRRGKGYAGGRRTWCKSCESDYKKEKYYANHEAELERRRRYRQKNKEKIAAYKREYQKANPEVYRESARRYRERHPERAKEATMRWREKNKERHREMQRRWREENREHIQEWRQERRERDREIQRKWREENPERSREIVRRYQARKMNATVEDVDYEAIIERDNMICHICGKRIRSRKDLHFDHIVPLSKGGEHSMRNVACAHAKCNLRKGDRGDIPVQTRLFGEV